MKILVPSGQTEDLVRFAEVEEPAPQPNQAVIAVEAFSVNRGEMFLLMKPREGLRPG
ncbi:MAG: hypothetical protein HOV96_34885 [Nonomuraea sp.]|nr:hypothetical protein [Nonomuraea sp.]